MKYVWIVILAISDLIWLICTIKNIYDTIRTGYKFRYIIDYIEPYSKSFFITHLVVFAVYSFALYIYSF